MTSPRRFRAACIQNSAGADPERNWKNVQKLIHEALRCRPHVIALPENFYWRGPKEEIKKAAGYTHTILQKVRALARARRTAFLLGSIIEASAKSRKFYNTSILIGPDGRIAARYRKIHLFDVKLPQGPSIRESDTSLYGTRVVTAPLSGLRAGLAICYDVRFPELFRRHAAAGSRLIFLPANFTRTTGKAHWELLIRARAVENQVFMIAPAQTGKHPVTGVYSYGHSLIVDPWGNVLAEAGGGRPQVIWADLNLADQDRLRREFPVLSHRRLDRVL